MDTSTLLQRLSEFRDRQSPAMTILLITGGSLALSEAIVATMSLLLRGEIDPGYLLTRCVASVPVSVMVSALIATFETELKGERSRALEIEASGRAFLEAVLDALPIPTLLKDESGRFVMVSRGTCAVLQKSREELINSTDAEPSSPDIARVVAQEDAHVMAIGRTFRAEVQIPAAGGSPRWFEKCGSAVTLPGGVRFIIAATLDIDDRRRAEEALRESEAFLRAAGRRTSDCGRGPCRTTRFTLPNRLGVVWATPRRNFRATGRGSRRSCIRPTGSISPRHAIGRARPRADRHEQEFRMRHRDGHWVWILSRARIERDPQRNAVRFVGCHLDTMARKDADATIRDHRDALVHEAEIRTAEAANRAKSAFLGNMSHELRTPPHSVLSFARLGAGVAARGESAAEKLARFFGNIEQSATRLHASLDRAPSIVDAAKVSQVLRELPSTAIRYSPDDTTVQVRLRDEPVTDQTDSPGRALRIEVIDEGLGIPEAELSTVFDRFVEGSKTRSSAGGTGLGLAICREVVSLYGGRIWAERNVTRGTTIVAILPQPADAPQIAGRSMTRVTLPMSANARAEPLVRCAPRRPSRAFFQPAVRRPSYRNHHSCCS